MQTLSTPAGRPPAVIGGFRSGTTYLIDLLGLHPELAAWHETKAFSEALRWQYVRKHPELAERESLVQQPGDPMGFNLEAVAARMRWLMQYDASSDFRDQVSRAQGQGARGKAAYEQYVFGAEYILYDLAEANTAVPEWEAAVRADATASGLARANGELIRRLGTRQIELAGRSQWVNKTPELPRFGRELRESIGRCRVILLVRDGRDVVLSAKNLKWGDVERLATLWKALIEMSRESSREARADYLEVRYEDLIGNPAPTLDRILVFLGVEPLGQRLLDEYRQRMGAKFIRPWHRRLARLYGAERKVFDAIAGELMSELGYR